MCHTSMAARIAALKPEADEDRTSRRKRPYARLHKLSRQLAGSRPGSLRHTVAARRLKLLHERLAQVEKRRRVASASN